MSKLKLHEFEQLSKTGTFDRVAVPGGWVYRVWNPSIVGDNDTGYAALCFVPSPRAPHARDRRRLRLLEGYTSISNGNFCHWRTNLTCVVIMSESSQRPGVTAWHADGSQTRHDSLLEAHDALVESGSPSPFEVVTGAAVETPQTHA
jgi:hypothetical protein